jgi:2-polyprenyl-6-hydroxyphenyl methylase/3-demethylubiquinone-9 3-methyltransferase
VLELGCGYGRVLDALLGKTDRAIGIDTSLASLVMGRAYLTGGAPVHLLHMDAVHLGFADGVFDTVCCIQNGISAFHVDQRALIAESVRVTKRGGLVLFSSYAEKIWEERLEWFRLQSAEGLIGEIDPEQSKDGTIVCRDGFTATTVGPERFLELAHGLGTRVDIVEVDESSLFCEITC